MIGTGVQLPEYRLVSSDTTACRLEFSVPRDLPYFDGHFSTAPVLPGIVQLGWMIEFAHRHLGMPSTVRKVEVLKFHKIITPEAELMAELQMREKIGQIAFRLASQSELHASGRLQFELSE